MRYIKGKSKYPTSNRDNDDKNVGRFSNKYRLNDILRFKNNPKTALKTS